MKKTLARILGFFMSAVMVSTMAYGEDIIDPAIQETDSYDSGAFMYDCVTGEETYIPDSDVSTYSNKTEGNASAYNPYADEEEKFDNNLQTNLSRTKEQVTDPTSSFTSRCTVFLSIETERGFAYGSGFLIRSNVVVTAGHCVYGKNYGENDWGWAKSITVTPATNATGNTAPYGTAKSTMLICGGKWAKNGNYDDDWGVIILDSNIGDRTGWFGLHWQSTSYNGTKATAKGYNRYRFQYVANGTISSSSSKTFSSKDIYTSEGMSGGPCYINIDGHGYVAIGIISYGLSYDSSGNYVSDYVFRRIDEALYNKLLRYCEEYAL